MVDYHTADAILESLCEKALATLKIHKGISPLDPTKDITFSDALVFELDEQTNKVHDYTFKFDDYSLRKQTDAPVPLGVHHLALWSDVTEAIQSHYKQTVTDRLKDIIASEPRYSGKLYSKSMFIFAIDTTVDTGYLNW